jgi:hypothetical protein
MLVRTLVVLREVNILITAATEIWKAISNAAGRQVQLMWLCGCWFVLRAVTSSVTAAYEIWEAIAAVPPADR